MPRASIRAVLGIVLIFVWSLNIWLTGLRLDLILVLILLIAGTLLTVLEWRGHPGIRPRKEAAPYLIWGIGGVLGLYALFQVLSN